ncbi:type II secretion system F family protein [Patescibacteria group bacterium]|nr:type II secretion system F family protein [Patescibacteria group bacterium]MBU1663638.1 type II secretion system F family protein [Patescibacteria group bacterium]MBU1934231.1 type II secretion system F family protein [Patescibacteria group bacterium]MBU2007930.1 type II secretion system F family protein [Patescibacteria group bacterium]MBU2233273.1 type II secretion system F family protein [Patescibacteria group bacterium]
MPINLPPQNESENESKNQSKKMGAINRFLQKFSPIPISEKLFFVQNLAIMLKAGISLSVTLKTLTRQTNNKRFSEIIDDISRNVENGVSFTESLRPHEKIFGQLFISMIESGEISGKLEDVLKKLYIQFKKSHELGSKVKGALTYPAVILVAITGIGIFMMISVIPKITAMFKDFNAELPLATKILIKLSGSLVSNGLLYLIGLIIFILILVQSIKTKKGKYIFHGLLLKLPILSPIIKKINLARFARTISSLLKTDIMLIKSFQITANVLGNVYYHDALNEMSDKIKKGCTINEVIANYPKLFPPVVTQMISVGEETGELDYILEELAEFYEGEIDQIMNNLPAIIEPILILSLGVIVGGIAVAVIMPMYSLTSVI